MDLKNKFLIAIILLSQFAKAQTSHHFGLFPTIDHSGTIANKFDYSLYYFGGFNLVNSEINGVKENANFFVFYAEQALTYNLNPKLSFTGSYVYERQYPTENKYRNENRFYLQSTYKHNLKRITLKHRLRFDGRFIENRTTGDSPFTSRIRYLFGIKTPLKKQCTALHRACRNEPVEVESDKLYFSMYNEFFFNLDKNEIAICGENWAYAGIGYNINKSNTIEVGPLYIFWVNNKQNALTNFYYLQLTWVSHIDFIKKKTK